MGNQLTADEAAVLAAGGKIKKGNGAGAMPITGASSEGGLSTKAGGKPMRKGKGKFSKTDDEDEDDEGDGEDMGDDEDEDEDEDEGENMKKKRAKKSGHAAEIIEAEDLIKSLELLEATSNGVGGEVDRRAELAEGLTKGSLSKAEKDELASLLGGTTTDDDDEDSSFGKSFSEEFSNDDQLAADYDVSEFLEKQSQLIAKSLDSVRSEVRSGLEGQQEFNRALAKSMGGMGRLVASQQSLIKSLSDQNTALASRLGIVERAPMPRKARVGSAKPIQKSSAGEASDEGMSRGDIMDGLEQLMLKSRDNNFVAPCGEPIDRAVALYEATGKITRGMLGDVADALGREINV